MGMRDDRDPLDQLDQLEAAVLASPRHRSVARELVRGIGARELAKGRDLRAAIKATKSKLHQVTGSYLAGGEDYASWLTELRAGLESGDAAEARQACLRVMARHASSRERLSILGDFYTQTLGPLAPIHRVLDIGCGLNPLALRWMPLANGAQYHACDVRADLVAFVGEYLALEAAHGPGAVRGAASLCDASQAAPEISADVALLLKMLPSLDQLDRAANLRLLRAIRAPHILVSFPVRSLGGRRKGMESTYASAFHALLAQAGWQARQFVFESELAFLVSK
jgi:16S rRNA (guanine(1405)-N(7))-methyltransferase